MALAADDATRAGDTASARAVAIEVTLTTYVAAGATDAAATVALAIEAAASAMHSAAAAVVTRSTVGTVMIEITFTADGAARSADTGAAGTVTIK